MQPAPDAAFVLNASTLAAIGGVMAAMGGVIGFLGRGWLASLKEENAELRKERDYYRDAWKDSSERLLQLNQQAQEVARQYGNVAREAVRKVPSVR